MERRWAVSSDFIFSFPFFSSLVVKAYVCHGGVLSVRDESFSFLAVLCFVQIFRHREEKQISALEME